MAKNTPVENYQFDLFDGGLWESETPKDLDIRDLIQGCVVTGPTDKCFKAPPSHQIRFVVLDPSQVEPEKHSVVTIGADGQRVAIVTSHESSQFAENYQGMCNRLKGEDASPREVARQALEYALESWVMSRELKDGRDHTGQDGNLNKELVTDSASEIQLKIENIGALFTRKIPREVLDDNRSSESDDTTSRAQSAATLGETLSTNVPATSDSRDTASRVTEGSEPSPGLDGGMPGSGYEKTGDNGNGDADVHLSSDRAETERITKATRHDYIIDIERDAIASGGEAKKADANLEAIRICQILKSERRHATPEEQSKLVKYTGWGGISKIFKDEEDLDKPWKARQAALKYHLSPTEYADARSSTQNAHYTDPEIIASMWQALEHMGFTGGKVFEPACGSGLFLGLRPLSMPMSLHGVEKDSISAFIAQELYQTAKIKHVPYEDLQGL